jgi:hypothetical protein
MGISMGMGVGVGVGMCRDERSTNSPSSVANGD